MATTFRDIDVLFLRVKYRYGFEERRRRICSCLPPSQWFGDLLRVRQEHWITCSCV